MWRPASRMAPNDIPLQISYPHVAPFRTKLIWPVWPIKYSGAEGLSLPRLDSERLCSFCLLLWSPLPGGWRKPLSMLWGCSSWWRRTEAAHQQPEPLTLRVIELLWKQVLQPKSSLQVMVAPADLWPWETAQLHHPRFPAPENTWEIRNSYCWGLFIWAL